MGPSQICGCPFPEPRVFEIAHMGVEEKYIQPRTNSNKHTKTRFWVQAWSGMYNYSRINFIYIYRHIQVGRGVDDFCVSLAWRQALCGPSNLQACLRNLEQHLLRALLFERSLEDVSESFTCPICCLESEHISRSARTLMVREGDSLIQEI